MLRKTLEMLAANRVPSIEHKLHLSQSNLADLLKYNLRSLALGKVMLIQVHGEKSRINISNWIESYNLKYANCNYDGFINCNQYLCEKCERSITTEEVYTCASYIFNERERRYCIGTDIFCPQCCQFANCRYECQTKKVISNCILVNYQPQVLSIKESSPDAEICLKYIYNCNILVLDYHQLEGHVSKIVESQKI